MKKQHIQLALSERIELAGRLLKSTLTVKMYRRILVLIEFGQG